MKTKEQKRREAIQRLEREPRMATLVALDTMTIANVWARRKLEAKRLREAFGVN